MNDRDWGLRPDEIDRIRAVLAAHPNVAKAEIYGSRALGTHRKGSDIDLTLDGKLEWQDLQQIEAELDSLDLPYTIDLSIKAQIENPALRQHIERHGQTIYNNEQTKQRTNEPTNQRTNVILLFDP